MLNILVSERPCRTVVHAHEKFSLSLHKELREPAMLVVPVFDAGHLDNILKEPCKTDVMHKVQDCSMKRFLLRLLSCSCGEWHYGNCFSVGFVKTNMKVFFYSSNVLYLCMCV